MLWQNVVNALIGIWFIIAPFSLGFVANASEMWTSIVGGAILLVLAGAAALNEAARRQTWIQYVNGLVGIWFIVAPWFVSFANRAADMYSSLIGGIIVLVLSAWLAFKGLPRTEPSH